MQYKKSFFIENREIALDKPTYFIADIASNHDGDINRAEDLIYIAKEAGADAVKFQHFLAEKIVSDYGFQNLNTQMSHQSGWKKSVFDVFKQYECKREWTNKLVETAKKAKVHFFTTPYDFEILELMDKFIPAYKIGSGDVTWIEFIEKVAKLNKPVFLATGASDLEDSKRAVEAVLKYNKEIVLMQCNTNYTGSLENYKFVNLRVLLTFKSIYPEMILGLSDHTPSHSAVLGAVTLGARVIEKHFTDNNDRIGPDHPFSMNPKTWKEMVNRTRELEYALGDGIKRIEDNEKDTAVLQRRCLRLISDKNIGDIIKREDFESLRPSPVNSFEPYMLSQILGKRFKVAKIKGDALYKDEVGE